MLLADRVCVVSGVGAGVGQAMAMAAAHEGATVVLASRTLPFLVDVAQRVRAAGGRALVVRTDITDLASCQALVDEVVGQFGRIDVLFNNAYVTDVYEEFATVDLREWRRIHDVNVFGTLQLTQLVVRRMCEQGSGSIVFVLSMTVRKPIPKQGGYTSSKAALLAAAQTIAKEVGVHGIRVNSVVPGWIRGDRVQPRVQDRAEREGITVAQIYDEVAKTTTAMHRIPTPQDTAEAAVFLASDRAIGITGQSLDVNGGDALV